MLKFTPFEDDITYLKANRHKAGLFLNSGHTNRHTFIFCKRDGKSKPFK